MKIMNYETNNGKKIRFDDFQDNTKEYNSFWVEMCPSCLEKYKDMISSKTSTGAMGTCSVEGCNNEADYYVDFNENEVTFTESNDNALFSAIEPSYGIKISYSWGDEEDEIYGSFKTKEEAYKEMCMFAAKEAFIYNEEFTEERTCQIHFDAFEKTIDLHYDSDNTWCYYRIVLIMPENLLQKYIESEYNEDSDEQMIYYVSESHCDIGKTAYLFKKENQELCELEIVHIIARSNNPDHYDNLLQDEDILINGEDTYNADTSCEFISDNDCYLVWFKYK